MIENLWGKKLNSSIYSGPVIFGNKLFCGVRDKFLYAIDCFTGDEIWSFDTQGNEVKHICVYGEFVFCSNLGYTLFAIDIKTGDEIWSFKADSRIGAPPSVENDIVYFGSQFVHKSTDKGDTWTVISPDLTTNDPDKLKQHESGGLTMDATGAENHCTILVITILQ